MDKLQVAVTLGGVFGAGYLTHVLAKARAKSEVKNKALEKSYAEIGQALSDYTAWNIEVLALLKEDRRNNDQSALYVDDKRATNWYYKIKDDSHLLPGLVKVIDELFAIHSGINESFKKYLSIPGRNSDDRPEVARYLNSDVYDFKVDIQKKLRVFVDHIDQLRGFVKYFCLRGMLPIKPPQHYAHFNPVLNVSSNGKVYLSSIEPSNEWKFMIAKAASFGIWGSIYAVAWLIGTLIYHYLKTH